MSIQDKTHNKKGKKKILMVSIIAVFIILFLIVLFFILPIPSQPAATVQTSLSGFSQIPVITASANQTILSITLKNVGSIQMTVVNVSALVDDPSLYDNFSCLYYALSGGQSDECYIYGNFVFPLTAKVNVTGRYENGSLITSTGYVNVTAASSPVTSEKTVFSETGLPSSYQWSVLYGGSSQSSGAAAIQFLSPEGTYFYSIAALQNTSSSCTTDYTPSSSSGSLVAGSSKSIIFISSTSCNESSTNITTFMESGLPAGHTWSIYYDSIFGSSSTSVISFHTGKGAFGYTVSNVYVKLNSSSGCTESYAPSPTSGNLVSGQTQFVTFSSSVVCTTWIPGSSSSNEVTKFTESGLPYGASWWVDYDGNNQSSNSTDNSISTASGTHSFEIGNVSIESIIANLSVGLNSYPFTAAYDPANGDMYVVDDDYYGNVTIINKSNDVVANLSVGQDSYPTQIAYNPTNGYMYVVDEEDGIVSVINEANHVIANISLAPYYYPFGITYDQANGDMYVTNPYYDIVSVINRLNVIIQNISLAPYSYPFGITYDQANGNIYVADNDYNGNITVINKSNDIVANLSVGMGYSPFWDAYDPANGDVYVTYQNYDGNVTVINESNDIVASLSAGPGTYPFGITYDQANGDMYVVDDDYNGNITIINESNDIVEDLSVGLNLYPTQIAYDQANGDMYVVDDDYYGNITVITSLFAGPTCLYIPSPSSGTDATGTLVSVYYSCSTTFTETGLPQGTSWNVTYDGLTSSSNSTNNILHTVAGMFSYSISTVTADGCLFVPLLSSGTVKAGAEVSVNYSCTKTYFTTPAYVTNVGGNTVSVVSSSGEYLGQIVVGSQPWASAFFDNASGYYAYVTNSGECVGDNCNGTVSVINVEDSEVIGNIIVGPSPRGISTFTNSSGTYAYVADGGSTYISVINTDDGEVIGNINLTDFSPYQITMFQNSSGTFAYVVDYYGYGNSSLVVINTANGAISTTNLGFNARGIVTFTNASGQFTYVGEYSYNEIAVLNTSTGGQIGAIFMPYYVGIRGMTVFTNTSGTFVYAADNDNEILWSINTQTGSVENITNQYNFACPEDVATMTNSSGTFAYMVDICDYSLWTINTANTSKIGEITGEGAFNAPYHISVDANLSLSATLTTFKEIGLPSGINWNVSYNYNTENSNTTSISFFALPTPLQYYYDTPSVSSSIAGCNNTYTPYPSNGALLAGSTVTINFSLSTSCVTTFTESGLTLYDGYHWNMSIDGVQSSSTNPSITITTSSTAPINYSDIHAPGIYFAGCDVSYYTASLSSGSVMAGGSVNINFTPSPEVCGRAYSDLVYSDQLSITNSEPVGVSGIFQQMVNVSLSYFSGYINTTPGYALQNVEFYNASNDQIIASWLENYSISGQWALYWIDLPNGIHASATLTDIYIGFAPESVSLFNGTDIGEAPELSAVYGEYDDGAYIFPYYQSFGGLSGVPNGWNVIPSTQISNYANYTSIGPAGPGWYGISLDNLPYSLSNNNTVWEFYGNMYDDAYAGVYAGLITSAGIGNNYQYTFSEGASYPNLIYQGSEGSDAQFAYSTGYYDTNNNKVYSMLLVSPTQLSMDIDYSTIFTNDSAPSAKVSEFVFAPSYSFIPSSSIEVYWLRTRACPPDGVMPSVSFG